MVAPFNQIFEKRCSTVTWSHRRLHVGFGPGVQGSRTFATPRIKKSLKSECLGPKMRVKWRDDMGCPGLIGGNAEYRRRVSEPMISTLNYNTGWGRSDVVWGKKEKGKR